MSTSSVELKGIMSDLPFAPYKKDSPDNQASVNQKLTDIKEDIDQLKRQLERTQVNYVQNGEHQEQSDQLHIAANIKILEQLIVLLRTQHDYATMLMLAGKFGTAEMTAALKLLNATLAEYNIIYSLVQTDLIGEIIKSRNNWQVGIESVRLGAPIIRMIIQAFTEMKIEIPINQLAELFNFID